MRICHQHVCRNLDRSKSAPLRIQRISCTWWARKLPPWLSYLNLHQCPFHLLRNTQPTSRTAGQVHSIPTVHIQRMRHNGIGGFETGKRFAHSHARGRGGVGHIRPPPGERKNPDAWISLLEDLIPKNTAEGLDQKPGLSHKDKDSPGQAVLQILLSASSKFHVGTNLLLHLGLQNDRWDTALDLVDLLLDDAASVKSGFWTEMNSPNLFDGVTQSLDELSREPIWLQPSTDISVSNGIKKSLVLHSLLGSQLDESAAQSKVEVYDRTMTKIWTTLGALIIEAADLPGSNAAAVMTFVYRVIAKIHNAGLIPKNVYSFGHSEYATSIQRPPIIYLLSSRILTTLSDAVWRAHSDEAIEKAARSGVSFKTLSHDPPGGRFRLRVRDLGPETWLEFVLWCCVDGGHAVAGRSIIERLQENKDNPWFAVNWMPTQTEGPHSSRRTKVDWNQVLLRTGGTVGRIEGYSSEQPFAVMDPRTISTEVVLATVEALVGSVNLGVGDRGTSLSKTQSSVRSLVRFLEPHNLPICYFNQLAVRLLQSSAFNPNHYAHDVHKWAEIILQLQALESTRPYTPRVSLDLPDILTQTELLNGIYHVSLEGFVVDGNIRQALTVFSRSQQLVDSSKLISIGAFLSAPLASCKGFFTSRTATRNEDFCFSHGQLPLYQIAAFLDLINDSGQHHVGNWLLFSADVDGPLIPVSAHASPTIAPVLIRFATSTGDQGLYDRVLAACRSRTWDPPISLWKSIAAANMLAFRFRDAHDALRIVHAANAGGCTPATLTAMAAAILSIEKGTPALYEVSSQLALKQALVVLDGMLQGSYDGNISLDFGARKSLGMRQVASILRILECIPHTVLSSIARKWRSRFEEGNDVDLPVRAFNTLLSGIVETRGAVIGAAIWDLFCLDPRANTKPAIPSTPNATTDTQESEDAGNIWDDGLDLDDTDDASSNGLLAELLNLTRFVDPDRGALGNDELYEDLLDEVGRTRSDDSTAIDAAFGDTDYIKPFEQSWSPHTWKESLNSDSHNNPVVRPNVSTLRIIVRGASQEYQLRKIQGESTAPQRQVLKWMSQFCAALGVRPSDILHGLDADPQNIRKSEHCTPLLQGLRDLSRADLNIRELYPPDLRARFSGREVAALMPSRSASEAPAKSNVEPRLVE